MPDPASITAIQTALKTAIETAAQANALALPVSVTIGDLIAQRPATPTEDQVMRVGLAYTGVTELARTSTRILEQALVNVNLSYRNADNSQTTRDNCHLTAQQLRDLLLNFTTTGARVEQLLTPHPFDVPKAATGEFAHALTLDLDILRTIAAGVSPEVTDTGDATPLLTRARSAVWDAINNWTLFAPGAENDPPAAWTRKYQSAADLEELSLHDPGAADLPAVAVTWGPTAAEWWVHTMQQWGQQLFVTFWLPAHWQTVAEWRLIQLTQAIYQSAPVETPSVSYVRRATGRPPSKNAPLSLELVALGRAQQLHAWRGTIALTLTTNFDPNAAA